MKFQFGGCTCNVDIFEKEDDIVVRFFDKKKEHNEKDIVDLVIVDPGYGYLSLKFKGQEALLSGFLDESFFHSNELVEFAIDFIKALTKKSNNAYIPHHIRKMRYTKTIEYNGEY